MFFLFLYKYFIQFFLHINNFWVVKSNPSLYLRVVLLFAHEFNFKGKKEFQLFPSYSNYLCQFRWWEIVIETFIYEFLTCLNTSCTWILILPLELNHVQRTCQLPPESTMRWDMMVGTLGGSKTFYLYKKWYKKSTNKRKT